jgi:hypothetical protein
MWNMVKPNTIRKPQKKKSFHFTKVMTAWGQNGDITVVKSADTLQGAECCDNI